MGFCRFRSKPNGKIEQLYMYGRMLSMANHKKVQKSTEIVNKKRPLEGVARNTYVTTKNSWQILKQES